MNMTLQKGDLVAIRDGQGGTKSVRVESVKPDYEHPGGFLRFDYNDNGMRRTAWPKELLSILKKSVVPTLDPKQPRLGDNEAQSEGKEIVIDGKRYIEKPTSARASQVNADAQTQVHPAAKAPAQPVMSRIKKAETVKSK